MRILLAEDDESLARITELSLAKKGGHEVLRAEDGAQAVELARSEKPDAVVMDMMMPKVDGIEACRRLKTDPETASIPVIFLTAGATKEVEAAAEEAGAAGIIHKPFLPAELAAQIEKILAS